MFYFKIKPFRRSTWLSWSFTKFPVAGLPGRPATFIPASPSPLPFALSAPSPSHMASLPLAACCFRCSSYSRYSSTPTHDWTSAYSLPSTTSSSTAAQRADSRLQELPFRTHPKEWMGYFKTCDILFPHSQYNGSACLACVMTLFSAGRLLTTSKTQEDHLTC